METPLTSSIGDLTVVVDTAVDLPTALTYWELYQETFGELRTLAAARQLLHKEEFLAEMEDGRVSKYVARDGQGRAVGMSTLTCHLETVPWISSDYFAHLYPEHAERQAIYYLGFTLVQRKGRRSRVFSAMIERIVELLVAERAVCAWDICTHNDEHLLLGANIERLLHRNADVTVAPIDRQTYYAGTFHGAHPVPRPRGLGA